MITKWTRILLACALSLALVACGRNTISPLSGDAILAEDHDAGGEQVEISMYTWWAESEQEMGEAVIFGFEAEHPDVKINANFVPYNDYLSKINTMIAVKNPPDVFLINEFLCNEWGELGIGKNLLEMYNRRGMDIEKLYLPSAMFRTGDNNLWGVSWGQSCEVLYYNKAMFAAAGVTPPPLSGMAPWTWEEFVDAAHKLTKDIDGNNPDDPDFDFKNIRAFGTLTPGARDYLSFLGMLYTNDVSIVSDDGKTLTLADPRGVEVVQKLADLSLVEKVAPSLTVQHSSFSNPSLMLMNDQLAMFVNGSYLYPNFANENYDVGVAQIPMFSTAKNVASGASYMVSADTLHPDAAFDLFTCLVDFDKYVDAAIQHNINLSVFPSTYASYNDPVLNEKWTNSFNKDMWDLTTDILNNTSRLTESVKVKNWSVIMDQTIMPALDQVYLGEKTAEEVCAQLKEELADEMHGIWIE